MTCSLAERRVDALQSGDLLLDTGQIVTAVTCQGEDRVIAWICQGHAGATTRPASALVRVARPHQVAA